MTFEVTTEETEQTIEFADYTEATNVVKRHIETYVDIPENWNESCPEVRTRPNPKGDKFASSDVDTYTMTLSCATKVNYKNKSGNRYNPNKSHPAGKKLGYSNRDYWQKRLIEKHTDGYQRISYDEVKERQNAEERYTEINVVASMLDLNERHRNALHNLVENYIDLNSAGIARITVVFAAAKYIMDVDPMVSSIPEGFEEVQDEIVSVGYVNQYGETAINNMLEKIKNGTALTEPIMEGGRELFGNGRSLHPYDRKQNDEISDTGFEDLDGQRGNQYFNSEGGVDFKPDEEWNIWGARRAR